VSKCQNPDGVIPADHGDTEWGGYVTANLPQYIA